MAKLARLRIQRRVKVENAEFAMILEGERKKGTELTFRLVDEDGNPKPGSIEEKGIVWDVNKSDNLYTIVPKEGQF